MLLQTCFKCTIVTLTRFNIVKKEQIAPNFFKFYSFVDGGAKYISPRAQSTLAGATLLDYCLQSQKLIYVVSYKKTNIF